MPWSAPLDPAMDPRLRGDDSVWGDGEDNGWGGGEDKDWAAEERRV